MKKLLPMICAAVLCVTSAAFATEPAKTGAAAPAVKAPSIDQIDLEKAMLTDKEMKPVAAKTLFGGKVSAVAFAQTACSNCRSEIQYLVGATKDYPKLQLVAAIVDMMPNVDRINSYLGELDFKGEVIADPKFAFAASVGVNQTPALVLVDKAGKVVFRSSGYDGETAKKIAEALKALSF